MDASRLQQFLAPDEFCDERFRQQIRKLGPPALRVMGVLEAVFGLALLAGGMGQFPAAALLFLGAASFAAAGLKNAEARARWMVLGSCFAGCLLILRGGAEQAVAPAAILLIAAVVLAPLRPAEALALGCAIAVTSPLSRGFLLLVAGIGAAVGALMGMRRKASYERHCSELRICETLAGAQVRAQLAESAAAIGKLAAAVTHEINTPLGALTSCVDTLLMVAARQAAAPPEKQQRLLEMQADLRRSIENSVTRIRNVVARLQRFINLEEAEVKTADINELLADVAVLFGPELGSQIRLDLRLAPLSKVTCRPQLLTSVFSSLLSNCIKAVNGDGHIVITSCETEKNIQVTFQDNGRGMSAEEVENIFDPSFRVANERVSSGNWSLFNARQIIFEHGGDVQIDSTEGKGTTISVMLPR